MSQSKFYIALQSATFDFKISTNMGTIEDTPPPGSNLDASPLGVDSLNGIETHVQAGVQTTSQPDMNDPLAVDIRNLLDKTKWPQDDVPAHHITSLTPFPTQDQDTNPSTAPSAAPPPSVHGPSASGSSPGGARSPKRAAKAVSSKLMSSALERFYNQSKVARHTYWHLSRIFEKTRTNMLFRSYRMFMIASRGFERGRVPTRRTKPSLHKRRYSVDVNTSKGWGTSSASDWRENDIKYEFRRPETSHLDPLPSPSHLEKIPHPARYAGFGTTFYMYPPFDTNVYLTLGDVTIHNDAFCSIGCTNWDDGGDPWMRDESLDMALEVLRRDLDCDDHGIAIANSMVSQICLFAVNSADSSPQEYAEYEARFCDKQWIFIVVNDATGRADTTSLQGNHWSLVVVDRIHRKTFYFDSLFINDYTSQCMGLQISRGMLKILGEDTSTWSYNPQYNTPHQYNDNGFRGDAGACGPFVFKITEMMIRHIRGTQSRDREDECDLQLYDGFELYFRDNFHSRDVRYDIQRRIARWKAITEAPLLANEHDWNAIHGTGVELDEGPVIHFDVPRRPEVVISQGDKLGNTYLPFDGSRHSGWVSPNEHYPASMENENYIRYGNDSTTIIDLASASEEELTDAEDQSDDEDSGISVVGPEEVEEKSVSGGLQEIMHLPGQPGEVSVTEDDDDNLI